MMTVMMNSMLLVIPLPVPMLLTTLAPICLVMRSTTAFSIGTEPWFRRRAGKTLFPWIDTKLAVKAETAMQVFALGTVCGR